jgi:hypothetical protein
MAIITYYKGGVKTSSTPPALESTSSPASPRIYTDGELMDMKKADLKAIAHSMDLDDSGTKRDIADRILEEQ